MVEHVELGYSYNALEPYIDAQTMEIHYSKHHKGYVNNANAAIEKFPDLKDKKIEEILKDLNAIPEEIKTAVTNNGGGVFNHNFFWTILKKNTSFSGKIADAINTKWGSFDKFKEEFSKATATRFGSGWAWLVVKEGKLEIITTPNQESPISQGMVPLLTIDVWEHAYYLKYQNKRPDYIEAFFNVINWDKVNEYFEETQ